MMKEIALLGLTLASGVAYSGSDIAERVNERLFKPVAIVTGRADGTTLAVDTEYIGIHKNFRSARLGYDFLTHPEKGIGDNANRSKLIQWDDEWFDCAGGTHMLNARQVRFTDDQRNLVPEAVPPQNWKRVAPHSLLEGGMRFVCAWVQATEAHWSTVNISSDFQYLYFTDVNSIRARGTIRHAWQKVVQGYHTKRGINRRSAAWVNYVLAYMAFDCDTRKSRTEALTEYDTDGVNYNLMREPQREVWEPVAPDTLQSSELQFVCTWKLQ